MLCGVLVTRFQDLLFSLLFVSVGSTTMDIDSLGLNGASEYFSDLFKYVFQIQVAILPSFNTFLPPHTPSSSFKSI